MADRDADYYQAHKDDSEEWATLSLFRGPGSAAWQP